MTDPNPDLSPVIDGKVGGQPDETDEWCMDFATCAKCGHWHDRQLECDVRPWMRSE